MSEYSFENFTVQGFAGGAVKSGIRGKDRLDLGIIVSDKPAVAAGVFTTSQVKAAPVVLGQERLKKGKAQAILVNSGIANACTGPEGMRNARLTAAMAADALGIGEETVQVSSTGVIGMQLDLECFRFGIPRLVGQLSPQGLGEVALAMMTTDTVPKTAVREFVLGGRPVKLAGMAKGAGMIMPNMATMLCYLLTDAAVEATTLHAMLQRSVAQSFNVITIDGDTSTNDTVLLLANGRAGNALVNEASSDRGLFQEQLDAICRDLALQIVRDGEGATKLVTVRVTGTRTAAEAEQAARTIANSNLVKTAFFGEDANWGRIIAALGRSGVSFAAEQVTIAFDQVVMVDKGIGLGKEAEAAATRVLKQKEFTLTIDLHGGEAAAEVFTCDFSVEYVTINADYRT